MLSEVSASCLFSFVPFVSSRQSFLVQKAGKENMVSCYAVLTGSCFALLALSILLRLARILFFLEMLFCSWSAFQNHSAQKISSCSTLSALEVLPPWILSYPGFLNFTGLTKRKKCFCPLCVFGLLQNPTTELLLKFERRLNLRYLRETIIFAVT